MLLLFFRQYCLCVATNTSYLMLKLNKNVYFYQQQDSNSTMPWMGEGAKIYIAMMRDWVMMMRDWVMMMMMMMGKI